MWEVQAPHGRSVKANSENAKQFLEVPTWMWKEDAPWRARETDSENA